MVRRRAVAPAIVLLLVVVLRRRHLSRYLRRLLYRRGAGYAEISSGKASVREDESTVIHHDPLAKPANTFASQFKMITAIVIPSYRSGLVALLCLHMALLGMRTYLSVVVARLDGRIVGHMMALDKKKFWRSMGSWMMLAVPASLTNGLIRYLERRIALRIRSTLVKYTTDLYLSGATNYRLRLDGDWDPSQHITTDIIRFSEATAHLYSRLGKPTLDIVIFSWQLSQMLGAPAALGIFFNYGFTAWMLQNVSPPFGRLASQEGDLEGQYRMTQARVIGYSEEIAFYDGAELERVSISDAYSQLASHIRKVYLTRAWYHVLEDFVLKYSWSASGYVFAAVPVFLWQAAASQQERMAKFITTKRLMTAMADAGGRIMFSIKDIAALAGHTRRISLFIAALHRAHSGDYENSGQLFNLGDIEGRIVRGEELALENVPVIVPGGGDLGPGEPLIDPITFEVNNTLLITGPNGVGKSSIARIMGGLWPVFRGELTIPPSIFILPQRPYFTRGTLRHQITYPHMDSLMTDDELQVILDKVSLGYIPAREGGFDARNTWLDVLSGGEKQRLLFARILHSSPSVAVIDEGTSAVSQDVEAQLYEAVQADGIKVVTISHSQRLARLHSAKLDIGLGPEASEWRFTEVTDRSKSPEEEISMIKEKLDRLPELMRRRVQITELLGLNT